MKRIALITLLATVGCKRTPDVPDALQAANKALAGVDLAIDGSKELIDAATEIQMARCQHLEPGDARGACMGALGRHVAPSYEKAAAAYDAAVAAIEAMEQAWVELQPILQQAREATGR